MNTFTKLKSIENRISRGQGQKFVVYEEINGKCYLKNADGKLVEANLDHSDPSILNIIVKNYGGLKDYEMQKDTK